MANRCNEGEVVRVSVELIRDAILRSLRRWETVNVVVNGEKIVELDPDVLYGRRVKGLSLEGK